MGLLPLSWQNLRPKPVLTLALKPGTDVTTVIPDTTEDTTDMVDTTDTPTDMDMDTVTWENAPLMPNPPLLLNLKLMLNPKLGTDITMVDITDIPTITDTMDILMDTTILERDPLTLNPKLPLKLPQKPSQTLVRILRLWWILRISLRILRISPCLLWSLLVVISCHS